MAMEEPGIANGSISKVQRDKDSLQQGDCAGPAVSAAKSNYSMILV